MRHLDGVLYIGYPGTDLKRRALLFDRFHVWEMNDADHAKTPEYEAELEFLRSKQIVVDAPSVSLDEFAESLEQHHFSDGFAFVRELEGNKTFPQEHIEEASLASARDLLNRYILTQINRAPDCDLVSICEIPLPSTPENRTVTNTMVVAGVALQSFPALDPMTSWDDILAFKADERDKKWAFRRWLHSLASKSMTEAEIRDEIEWSLNEYRRAMELHHLKASNSFVDVFVITPLEILENLVKFNWSKIAKGALQVRKRRVDLLEAEMKAPGREAAYVFDARKHFAQSK